MPSPISTPSAPSNSVLDEAVHIAAQGSRRTAESAQAALQGMRAYLDQTNQIARDVLELWTNTYDAGFKTAFDVQNAAIANTQAWFDASATSTRTAFQRYAELARQAQATTLKSYQAASSLLAASLVSPD